MLALTKKAVVRKYCDQTNMHRSYYSKPTTIVILIIKVDCRQTTLSFETHSTSIYLTMQSVLNSIFSLFILYFNISNLFSRAKFLSKLSLVILITF